MWWWELWLWKRGEEKNLFIAHHKFIAFCCNGCEMNLDAWKPAFSIHLHSAFRFSSFMLCFFYILSCLQIRLVVSAFHVCSLCWRGFPCCKQMHFFPFCLILHDLDFGYLEFDAGCWIWMRNWIMESWILEWIMDIWNNGLYILGLRNVIHQCWIFIMKIMMVNGPIFKWINLTQFDMKWNELLTLNWNF